MEKPRLGRRRALAVLAAIGSIVVVLGVGTALATSPTGPLPLPHVTLPLPGGVSSISSLPPDKAKAWEKAQQRLDEARAHPVPKPAVPPPAPSGPTPTPIMGIFDRADGAAQAGGFGFEAESEWIGRVGAGRSLTYVVAGARHSGADSRVDRHGAVRVLDSKTRTAGTFDAPTGADWVKVIAAKGDMLELRSASGETLWFDLDTYKFQ